MLDINCSHHITIMICLCVALQSKRKLNLDIMNKSSNQNVSSGFLMIVVYFLVIMISSLMLYLLHQSFGIVILDSSD